MQLLCQPRASVGGGQQVGVVPVDRGLQPFAEEHLQPVGQVSHPHLHLHHRRSRSDGLAPRGGRRRHHHQQAGTPLAPDLTQIQQAKKFLNDGFHLASTVLIKRQEN
jgi:hypothetical protein